MEKEDIKLKVVDREGEEHEISAPLGMNLNVMEVMKASGLPVEGTCGGMALCASCHVYVLSDHALEESSEDEEAMLDSAFFVEDNSRLSCQLAITEDKDGLRLRLAQHELD